MNNQKTLQQAERVEEILRRFDASEDERAKQDAAELVQALMDIHGSGLRRVVDLLSEDGSTGPEILKKMAADENVSGLLILYGLHPASMNERVRQAIAELEPVLASQQAKLETVSFEDGHLHLSLVANGSGCHSGGAELKQFVENAIIGAVPDLNSLELELASPPAVTVFVPLLGLKKTKMERSESQAALA